ncbi:MAG: hypothetical protein H0T17_05495 [Propionibacteriales bacterium]|nr:hypothetical protein [Propionibacteriales bacterium]
MDERPGTDEWWYDERPPLVHSHNQDGLPHDARRMGLDRNTEEGALIAMAGSLDSGKVLHRVVAWLLLASFSFPVLMGVWHEIV